MGNGGETRVNEGVNNSLFHIYYSIPAGHTHHLHEQQPHLDLGFPMDSVFEPNQINLDEMTSSDVESFKRFNYFFDPKNKMKGNLSVQDIYNNSRKDSPSNVHMTSNSHLE